MARVNARTGATTIWPWQRVEVIDEWRVPWRTELCANGQMKGRMKVFDELWPSGRNTRGGTRAGINGVPALRLWEEMERRAEPGLWKRCGRVRGIELNLRVIWLSRLSANT